MYLAELNSRTEPIRVGVVGIGRMGRGVVDQVTTMPCERTAPTRW
jgi:predicted homoserine dehydrogenase-like protein